MSAASNFLVQFKSYCTSLEADTRQLRQTLENRPTQAERASKNSATVDRLLDKAEGISSLVAAMEEELLGPADTRLATITIEEVLSRGICTTLVIRQPLD